MGGTVKVGVLNDMADGPRADGEPQGDVTEELRREIEAVRAEGRLEAEIEFVHAWGLGLPAGTAAAVERAYAELVDAGVVLIVGPAIGDNALIATPLAEAAKVPTLNWAGAERGRGEWMFHLQVGSHEDESLVMARHMQAIGARRLAVVFDQSPIGTRHLEYLYDEAAIVGVEVVAAEPILPLAEDAAKEVERALRSGADGFVYLGLGLSAAPVARALTARDWQGARIMNTAGLRGYYGDFARACDGWLYVDMHSDANRTLTALREARSTPPERALWAAKGHDLGRLVAEGLARAPAFTRDGLRLGLEKVKWLPAAEGEDGTLLGFGIQDRGALHGRYLVVRQWIQGRSVEMTT
jgi:branched-chain amino acid transport system substrate-binding protein